MENKDQLRGIFWGKPGVCLAALSQVQSTARRSGSISSLAPEGSDQQTPQVVQPFSGNGCCVLGLYHMLLLVNTFK